MFFQCLMDNQIEKNMTSDQIFRKILSQAKFEARLLSEPMGPGQV